MDAERGLTKTDTLNLGGCKSAPADTTANGRPLGGLRDPTGATVPLRLETSTCATVASVGMPPEIRRAGAGACTTPFEQDRQAYFGRRVTPLTRVNMRCRAADDPEPGRDHVEAL